MNTFFVIRLLTIAGAIWLLAWLYGRVGRTTSREQSRDRWMLFFIAATFLVVLLLVVHRRIIAVLLLVLLFIALVVCALNIVRDLRHKRHVSQVKVRARRALTRGPSWSARFSGPQPREVAALAADLELVGFRRVSQRLRGEDVVLLLFRSTDSIAGEVIHQQRARRARVTVELTSVLSSRRGILSTTNLASDPRLWKGVLLQAFPGARPGDLVQRHERALAVLAERGLPPDPIAEATLHETLDWAASMQWKAAVQTPYRELTRLLTKRGIVEWLRLGPLETDPRLEQRLAQLPAVAA